MRISAHTGCNDHEKKKSFNAHTKTVRVEFIAFFTSEKSDAEHVCVNTEITVCVCVCVKEVMSECISQRERERDGGVQEAQDPAGVH